MSNSIEANGLTKRYGDKLAVNSLDLDIDGEIYGLLGPNGSGKTTTVNMLTTMLSITAGSASVCGYDVRTQPKKVRECISYIPQYIAADIKLTGRENVTLFAELYGIRDASERKRKVDECLEIMGLSDRADDITKSYSGGMNRRLEIAQALVHDPRVLFLDEPTLGLDVIARRELWRVIEGLKGKMTIVLTTHYMEEAEALSDRIGIMKDGKLLFIGTKEELYEKTGKGDVENAFLEVVTGGEKDA